MFPLIGKLMSFSKNGTPLKTPSGRPAWITCFASSKKVDATALIFGFTAWSWSIASSSSSNGVTCFVRTSSANPKPSNSMYFGFGGSEWGDSRSLEDLFRWSLPNVSPDIPTVSEDTAKLCFNQSRRLIPFEMRSGLCFAFNRFCCRKLLSSYFSLGYFSLG